MSEEKIEVLEQNYGPGNVLRAKREEYEWSIEAVAEALHLSTHSVKAIEADRYDELPGATYVIGYWRSYARLLGIDIEETIEVNKRNLNIVTAESSGLDVNRAFRNKTRSGGLGWVLFVVILGALGFFGWKSNFWGLLDSIDGDEQGTVSMSEQVDTQGAEPAAEQQPQVLMPLESQTAPAAATERTEPESAAAVEERQPSSEGLVLQSSQPEVEPDVAPVDDAPQAGLVMASTASQQSAGGPAEAAPNLLSAQTAPPATEADPAATLASVNSTEQQPDTASAEAAPASATGPAGDASTMVLKLSKDSWLDIRDKTNKRLLYKTESAGKTIRVTGTPPFYVYIGTPDGVTVTYQGKDVPFETHKSGLFARFKLGDEILESL